MDIRISPRWFVRTVVGTVAFECGACGITVEPIQVGKGCPEAPLRGPEAWKDEPKVRLIDDFEGGGTTLPRNAGRDGSWILGDANNISSHPINPSDIKFENSNECAARGTRSGHFSGSTLVDWGANSTATFRATTPMPAPNPSKAQAYNAESYSGISFWAATGATVREVYEVPVGVTTIDVAYNGYVCPRDFGQCNDYYGTTVPLTSRWERFVLRFDELDFVHSGADGDLPFRLDQLVGFIVFPTPLDGEFDVWVDDLRFEP